MDWLEQAISEQRSFIEAELSEPLSKIADICVIYWQKRNKLDDELRKFLSLKPEHRCRLLYVIDKDGKQYSSNISDEGVDRTTIGRDLSNRPYLNDFTSEYVNNFKLSEVYIDKASHKPCITALHTIKSDNQIYGYIAADFNLKNLPLKIVNENSGHRWRQIKGDPSIRGTLFHQTRTNSTMDEHIDEVMDVVESLMSEQGIFHAKLHFSSSRATLWSYSDPYRYRLHVLDEIINPDVCLVYAKQPFPEDAAMTSSIIPEVLSTFKTLRELDDTIYLRSASLNIMNGLVGLNFSCDGSHYMLADEFLEKNLNFWLGVEQQDMCQQCALNDETTNCLTDITNIKLSD